MKRNGKKTILIISIVLVFILALLSLFNKKIITSKIDLNNSKELADSIAVGTVNIEYVTKDGVYLGKDSINGNVGTWYSTQRKSFESYVAYGDEPLNKKGYFNETETVVTYTYEKMNVLNSYVTENNQVNIDVYNSRKSREYDLSIKTIATDSSDNSVENLTGIEFKISKDSDIIKEGSSNNGEAYIGTITVRNEEETIYTIEETKSLSGYAQKLVKPLDIKLIKKWNDENSKFEITLDYDTSIEGVSVKLEDEKIIVILDHTNVSGKYSMNIVTSDKSTGQVIKGAKFKITKRNSTFNNEVVTDNSKNTVGEFELSNKTDETEIYYIEQIEPCTGYTEMMTEILEVQVTKMFDSIEGKYYVDLEYDTSKANVEASVTDEGEIIINIGASKDKSVYDLGIQYFLSTIDSKNAQKEPMVKIDDDGNIDFNKEVINSDIANEQEVVFEARIFNVADNKVNGKKIKIDIPNGFKYNPENEINKKYKWNMYKQNENKILVETQNKDEAQFIITDYIKENEISKYDSSKNNYEFVKVDFTIDETKVESSRYMINTAEIINNEDDINKNNDKSSEYLYIKYFDLKTEKFIEDITITTDGNSEIKKYGINEKSKISKLDIASSKLDTTKLLIKYGIKVSNVGEIPGRALEIVDNIPEGLVFDESKNEGWYKDGEVIKNNSLNNVVLEPGESVIIYINLDWDLSKESVGKKVNSAEVSTYYNEYDAKDINDDNKDSKEILVTVKTGAVTYALEILTGLIIVTIIVIFNKRRISGRSQKHAK